MQFSEYINQFSWYERPKRIREIANALNITESAVRHWANGTRPVGAKHVRPLEKLLNGAVTCAEARPDLYDAGILNSED